jgi:hypothetical protein
LHASITASVPTCCVRRKEPIADPSQQNQRPVEMRSECLWTEVVRVGRDARQSTLAIRSSRKSLDHKSSRMIKRFFLLSAVSVQQFTPTHRQAVVRRTNAFRVRERRASRTDSKERSRPRRNRSGRCSARPALWPPTRRSRRDQSPLLPAADERRGGGKPPWQQARRSRGRIDPASAPLLVPPRLPGLPRPLLRTGPESVCAGPLSIDESVLCAVRRGLLAHESATRAARQDLLVHD